MNRIIKRLHAKRRYLQIWVELERSASREGFDPFAMFCAGLLGIVYNFMECPRYSVYRGKFDGLTRTQERILRQGIRLRKRFRHLSDW